MLTLFTTPVIYLYFDRISRRFRRNYRTSRPGLLIPGGAIESDD
jgi:hypothetical protein